MASTIHIPLPSDGNLSTLPMSDDFNKETLRLLQILDHYREEALEGLEEELSLAEVAAVSSFDHWDHKSKSYYEMKIVSLSERIAFLNRLERGVNDPEVCQVLANFGIFQLDGMVKPFTLSGFEKLASCLGITLEVHNLEEADGFGLFEVGVHRYGTGRFTVKMWETPTHFGFFPNLGL
jgi:hypothetical protein